MNLNGASTGVDRQSAADPRPGPRFDVLLGGHHKDSSPESTIVLAAALALNGLRADGEPMPGAGGVSRAPTLRAIASEIGRPLAAVRRGVQQLHKYGLVDVQVVDGPVRAVVAVPAEAAARRWKSRSCSIRLTREPRSVPLECRSDAAANAMLVVGLVAGNLDRRGRLVLGLDRMCAITGVSRRALQRAIALAEQHGLLHRWTIPGRWLSCFAVGRRAELARGNGAELAQGIGTDRSELAQENELAQGIGGAEVARPPLRSGAVPPSEVARPPLRSGASTQPT